MPFRHDLATTLYRLGPESPHAHEFDFMLGDLIMGRAAQSSLKSFDEATTGADGFILEGAIRRPDRRQIIDESEWIQPQFQTVTLSDPRYLTPVNSSQDFQGTSDAVGESASRRGRKAP
ncbi:hypothetical protein GGTG_08384 [Gaeumannomyces tritici R3-111a-1]|uniref:Uncharacterized protein n=1 Tax=Gaeumannomyces tritici (strain R3-111a-1) TaxID=644352 RepID=J3P4E8_GAET3|nr:hypothetical protein GGTG_08384 [Gaeumannomyces tritici R3-111a-1]EJT74544.1 hypothetical protein GGTG_08384 [Gaeumannomyces tritici R3-111a-1]